MSERITLCPKCRGDDVDVIKIHNPETHDMNSEATLHCLTCDNTWEGEVTSHRTEELYRKGQII